MPRRNPFSIFLGGSGTGSSGPTVQVPTSGGRIPAGYSPRAYGPGDLGGIDLPAVAADPLAGTTAPMGNGYNSPPVTVDAPSAGGYSFDDIPRPETFIPPPWIQPPQQSQTPQTPFDNSVPQWFLDAIEQAQQQQAPAEEGEAGFIPPGPFYSRTNPNVGRGFLGPYGQGQRFGQGVGDFGVDRYGNYGQQSYNAGAYLNAIGAGIDASSAGAAIDFAPQ